MCPRFQLLVLFPLGLCWRWPSSCTSSLCAFLSITPSVLFYMTPLTFFFNFDQYYLINQLVKWNEMSTCLRTEGVLDSIDQIKASDPVKEDAVPQTWNSWRLWSIFPHMLRASIVGPLLTDLTEVEMAPIQMDRDWIDSRQGILVGLCRS